MTDKKEEPKNPSPAIHQAEKKDNKKNIIIAILAIIVIVNLIKVGYDYFDKKGLIQDKSELRDELDKSYFQLDSIGRELQFKIDEISQLGGEVEELEKIKKELEEEKAKIRRNANVQIAALKDKVGGYQELLLEQDKEIARLKSMNEELYSENTSLKEERNKMTQSLNRLSQSKDELEEKVAVASRLKVESMRIFAVNNRGKEREGEFRNRQLEDLKIVMTIAENKVAPIEGKDILIRITDPKGDILFDVATGSGSFMLDGKETFFTAKQEILYDKTRQEVAFVYSKGSDYESGLHKVEAFTDNYKMGEATFMVK